MPRSMNPKPPTIISLGLEALRRLFADEAIPLAGNLLLAASVDRARRLLTSPAALRRMNLIAGSLMIAVGVLIAAS